MDEALKAANRQLEELRRNHNQLLRDYKEAVRGRCNKCVHFVNHTACELPGPRECSWEFSGWKPHDKDEN